MIEKLFTIEIPYLLIFSSFNDFIKEKHIIIKTIANGSAEIIAIVCNPSKPPLI